MKDAPGYSSSFAWYPGYWGGGGVLCEIALCIGRDQVNSGRKTDGIYRLAIFRIRLSYQKQEDGVSQDDGENRLRAIFLSRKSKGARSIRGKGKGKPAGTNA